MTFSVFRLLVLKAAGYLRWPLPCIEFFQLLWVTETAAWLIYVLFELLRLTNFSAHASGSDSDWD